MTFKKLLGEMETMLKAEGAEGDATIAAAAAAAGNDTTGGAAGDDTTAGAAGDDTAAGAAGDDTAGGAAGADKQTMAKSFEITLEDGTKFMAEDAGEILKALTDRLTETESDFGKALGMAVNLIKAQGVRLGELTAQVEKLGSAGAGRKTVLSIVGKNGGAAGAAAAAAGADPLIKSHPELTTEAFFTKAFAAQRAGRITSRDISMAESCLNRGEAIPAAVINAVMSEQAA